MAGKLKTAWDSFERDVIPRNAPPVQRSEMRNAFYAGAWSVIAELMGIDHGVPDEVGIAIMDGLHRECVEYQRAVLRRHAEGN